MKIWDTLIVENTNKKTLEEGWKENVLATVFSIASFFGGAKSQSNQNNTDDINISQSINNDSVKLDIGKIFKSGEYNFSKEDSKLLASELRKLGAEILKNPTSNFVIEVVSSESLVTNYDLEVSSDTYKQKLKTGELAKKRAETAIYILDNFVKQLKKEGVLKGEVKFNLPPKILIGDVPWPSVDPATKKNRKNDDQVYTKDQYVTAYIKIISTHKNTVDIMAGYANIGEPIFYNNRLIGMAFYRNRESDDKTKSGNLNTAEQDIIFKLVKPNTPLKGLKNENGVYLKTYIIPWMWWNKNVFNHVLTNNNMNHILKNFSASN